ncbi:YqgE/AlgH family protein [Actinospica sp.]|jgi:putative transcriptional regulator|uniref:YqgE/AlgH family protein n=1 Tax=Actinospica sp. TaxID=1872142 RepID=UPI002B7D782E|nr:YqgE/AlgH family protein [Actinospica sp.]HWG24125.1 YqgE/AlgH family protein [Actinospica sp.]
MSDTELTGRLLVATPLLVDPNFDRAVVLVLDHDTDGTLGVVINRPTTVPVHEVLPAWSELAGPMPMVFQGGPVALDSALGLAELRALPRGEDPDPLGWRRVHGDLGLVDLDLPPELLAAEISAFRVYAGYAGWSAGQLERELGQGAWYVIDAAPADAFTLSPELAWRTVLRRQRGGLALLSTFPDDPELN